VENRDGNGEEKTIQTRLGGRVPGSSACARRFETRRAELGAGKRERGDISPKAEG